MCTEHDILRFLYYGNIATVVLNKLPFDLVRKFKEILEDCVSPSGVIEKDVILIQLMHFLKGKIKSYTLCVNLDALDLKDARTASP